MIRLGIISNRVVARVGLQALARSLDARITFEAGTDCPSWPAAEQSDALLLDTASATVDACLGLCRYVAHIDQPPRVIGVGERDRVSPRFHELVTAGMTSYADLDQGCPLEHVILESIAGRSVVYRGHDPWGQEVHVTDLDARILLLLAEGLTDHAIAEQVGRGESTVKHRIEALMRALGLRSRFQLGAWADEHGLVSAPAAPFD